MAREKGTGNLQQEKSGRWTVRVGINGRRLSRSARTTDRVKAEAFLNRFLAPLGLGATKLPLAEAWHHYEMSPNRRDIARSTLDSKRTVWMGFARWMEQNHVEIGHLAEVTKNEVAEYLAEFRCHHAATTYNNHVCVLREVFRLLADKAGITHDPWAGVCLRADDSMSRRELSLDEVGRLYTAASKEGLEWKLLMVTGIYTGMRLGDCCRLVWESVNLERRVIQVVPEKTKKHAHGRPVTIPIHQQLGEMLMLTPEAERKGFVNPSIAEAYTSHKWDVDEGLRRIFKAANITMSVRIEGRSRKTVVASFHSLRHTFVSLSANAGVPLPVVQSIVGHTSTAMTRHYYHENEAVLRQAVDAIPAIGAALGKREEGRGKNGLLSYLLPLPPYPQGAAVFLPALLGLPAISPRALFPKPSTPPPASASWTRCSRIRHRSKYTVAFAAPRRGSATYTGHALIAASFAAAKCISVMPSQPRNGALFGLSPDAPICLTFGRSTRPVAAVQPANARARIWTSERGSPASDVSAVQPSMQFSVAINAGTSRMSNRVRFVAPHRKQDVKASTFRALDSIDVMSLTYFVRYFDEVRPEKSMFIMASEIFAS